MNLVNMECNSHVWSKCNEAKFNFFIPDSQRKPDLKNRANLAL